jgi:Protein of unknown function (DUF4232)
MRRSAARATSGRCASDQLVLERVRFGTAGTFHKHLDMALVNTSRGSCTLAGWPRVQLLDRDVRSLRIPIARSHPYPPHAVHLRTWGRAYFTLHYLGSGPGSHRTTAYGVRVTPPAGRRGLIIAQRLDLCTPARASLDPYQSPPTASAALHRDRSASAHARLACTLALIAAGDRGHAIAASTDASPPIVDRIALR